MVALSLAGIDSSFGMHPVPVAAWTISLAAAAALGHALFRDRRVRYDTTDGKFLVPGSWVPLAVIMAIFFTKYVHAVMSALGAAVIESPVFVLCLSGAYGLLSGYFAARALNLVSRHRW